MVHRKPVPSGALTSSNPASDPHPYPEAPDTRYPARASDDDWWSTDNSTSVSQDGTIPIILRSGAAGADVEGQDTNPHVLSGSLEGVGPREQLRPSSSHSNNPFLQGPAQLESRIDKHLPPAPTESLSHSANPQRGADGPLRTAPDTSLLDWSPQTLNDQAPIALSSDDAIADSILYEPPPGSPPRKNLNASDIALPAAAPPSRSPPEVPTSPGTEFQVYGPERPFIEPSTSLSQAGWGPDPSTSLPETIGFQDVPSRIGDGNQQTSWETWEDQQAWEKKEEKLRQNELPTTRPFALNGEQEQFRNVEDEWSRGEEKALREAQYSPEGTAKATFPVIDGNQDIGTGPPLPPRQFQDRVPLYQEETPPQKPPRPQVNPPPGTASLGTSGPETPDAKTRKQRSETYQVKQINWFDYRSPKNPRRSPILVQNANGPCPLLALVNALVLSTMYGIDTALTDSLTLKENVSLGLLLDAVFDELTSGRRAVAEDLPDVAELYKFLITLHTGMNVNPSFVTPNHTENPRAAGKAPVNNTFDLGSFEETNEVRLYRTFNIPLIHGWIPEDEITSSVLERSARTYEDAQNLQFREEELEEKLQQDGLTSSEATLLQDIQTIKFFLRQSATQLTRQGLQNMQQQLPPGSIRILFRNDHFSTLYKHPETGRLFILVTDAGYAGHEEIVWESLVDVTGEGSEFYSGDFRPVSASTQRAGGSETPIRSLLDDEEGWTTVSRSKNKTSSGGPPYQPPPQGNIASIDSRLARHFDESMSITEPYGAPGSPKNTEQEDHDLALALQLQEEEEERHRREQEARRREETLSQQFIANESSPQRSSRLGPSPGSTNPLRNSTSTTPSQPRSQNRRPVHDPEAGIDQPPPPYEATPSSNNIPFPTDGTGAGPGMELPSGAQQGGRSGRRQSAYGMNNADMAAAPGQSHGRRMSRSVQPTGVAPGTPVRSNRRPSVGMQPKEDDEKCVVM